ncbi:hypothetical protein SNEBB_003840 [Seison nebaliae]|nr:hypothetical protein SNEBB_003840 [Seison nebaliae]
MNSIRFFSHFGQHDLDKELEQLLEVHNIEPNTVKKISSRPMDVILQRFDYCLVETQIWPFLFQLLSNILHRFAHRLRIPTVERLSDIAITKDGHLKFVNLSTFTSVCRDETLAMLNVSLGRHLSNLIYILINNDDADRPISIAIEQLITLLISDYDGRLDEILINDIYKDNLICFSTDADYEFFRENFPLYSKLYQALQICEDQFNVKCLFEEKLFEYAKEKCRELYEEVVEVECYLHQIEGHLQSLDNQNKVFRSQTDRINWVKKWLYVMRELRNGICLKHVPSDILPNLLKEASTSNDDLPISCANILNTHEKLLYEIQSGKRNLKKIHPPPTSSPIEVASGEISTNNKTEKNDEIIVNLPIARQSHHRYDHLDHSVLKQTAKVIFEFKQNLPILKKVIKKNDEQQQEQSSNLNQNNNNNNDLEFEDFSNTKLFIDIIENKENDHHEMEVPRTLSPRKRSILDFQRHKIINEFIGRLCSEQSHYTLHDRLMYSIRSHSHREIRKEKLKHISPSSRISPPSNQHWNERMKCSKTTADFRSIIDEGGKVKENSIPLPDIVCDTMKMRRPLRRTATMSIKPKRMLKPNRKLFDQLNDMIIDNELKENVNELSETNKKLLDRLLAYGIEKENILNETNWMNQHNNLDGVLPISKPCPLLIDNQSKKHKFDECFIDHRYDQSPTSINSFVVIPNSVIDRQSRRDNWNNELQHQQQLDNSFDKYQLPSSKEIVAGLLHHAGYVTVEDLAQRLERSNDVDESKMLSLAELKHIRKVLTIAEKDSLLFDIDLHSDVQKGRICFTCRKTRFGLIIPWKFSCYLCEQNVCKKCIDKICIPLNDNDHNQSIVDLSDLLLDGKLNKHLTEKHLLWSIYCKYEELKSVNQLLVSEPIMDDIYSLQSVFTTRSNMRTISSSSSKSSTTRKSSTSTINESKSSTIFSPSQIRLVDCCTDCLRMVIAMLTSSITRQLEHKKIELKLNNHLKSLSNSNSDEFPQNTIAITNINTSTILPLNSFGGSSSSNTNNSDSQDNLLLFNQNKPQNNLYLDRTELTKEKLELENKLRQCIKKLEEGKPNLKLDACTLHTASEC